MGGGTRVRLLVATAVLAGLAAGATGLADADEPDPGPGSGADLHIGRTRRHGDGRDRTGFGTELTVRWTRRSSR